MLLDAPYEEIISHRSTLHGSGPVAGWAELPFAGRILQAVPAKGDGVHLRTTKELWSTADAKNWYQLQTSFGTGVLLDGGANAVAHSNGVSVLSCAAATCNETLVATLDPSCGSTVTGGAMDAGSGEVVVGCAAGLFVGVGAAASPPPLIREPSIAGPVAAASSWSGFVVAAATAPAKLHWRRPDGSWWWEWTSTGDASTCGREYAGGAVEAVPAAIAFDAAYGAAGGAWLGHSRGLQALDLQSGALRRFGPIADGLPVANIAAAAVTPTSSGAGDGAGVWLGTSHGVARRLGGDEGGDEGGGWRYYAGRRWLPSDRVTAVAPLRAGAILAVSDGGVAVLEAQAWTLAQKAAHYQDLVSPRHDRYGYVEDCGLGAPGNLSSYVLHDSDNDGLWTAMYTAGQAFRFAATGDAAARAEAMRRYAALHFLFEVPAGGAPGGVRGHSEQALRFPARSVARVGDTIHSGGADCKMSAPHCWRNSSTHPGWVWKADTSSDEVTGHMFVYPILRALLQLNGSEAASVRGLVDGLVGGILAHNLSLIDPYTNQPTTWGKFSPHWLNDVVDWSDDRGLRAIEMLTYLVAAEEVTGDATYRQAADELRGAHGYGRMMVNAKITDPCDNNHSDDEEAFLPLYTYLQAYKRMGRQREPEFDAALARFCRVTRPEGSSLYLAICALAAEAGVAGVGAGGGSAPDALRENLRGWPLELIKWSTRNSVRDDLRHRPPPNDDEATTVIPSRDAGRYKWNADPFTMDDGGGGMEEGDPGAWLLAFWMARHHGLIGAPTTAA